MYMAVYNNNEFHTFVRVAQCNTYLNNIDTVFGISAYLYEYRTNNANNKCICTVCTFIFILIRQWFANDILFFIVLENSDSCLSSHQPKRLVGDIHIREYK